MGGLKKYMPITYWTFLVGALALIGFPGFAGFFSKDSIIEAVHISTVPGAGFAYAAVLVGVFITALYTFRMFFLVFHGKERMDEHTRHHLHESPLVVTVPLILLAVPSVIIGALAIGPLQFGDFFGRSIYVLPEHDVLGVLASEYHGALNFIWHGLLAPAVWLSLLGVGVAWFVYLKRPGIAGDIKERFPGIYKLLDRKYGADDFNDAVFAGGGRGLGRFLWRFGDIKLIDGVMVNGTAFGIGRIAGVIRRVQSGFLYHYAFAMIIGLLVLLTWFVF